MFQRIKFHEAINVVHLDWIQPEINESLGSYCFRFSRLVDSSKPFSILGLSFGGVIAIELTSFLNPQHLILLSSLSSRHELPLAYRLVGSLRLHKLIPTALLKTPTRITFWYFGVRKTEDKKMLAQILRDTSSRFLNWAVDKVLTWQRSDRPAKIFHIHGTDDRIIPFVVTKADLPIEGAGHLMVYTHAGQVSKSINKELGFR